MKIIQRIFKNTENEQYYKNQLNIIRKELKKYYLYKKYISAETLLNHLINYLDKIQRR